MSGMNEIPAVFSSNRIAVQPQKSLGEVAAGVAARMLIVAITVSAMLKVNDIIDFVHPKEELPVAGRQDEVPDSIRQDRLAAAISKNYRIPEDNAYQIVSEAFEQGRKNDLAPEIILGVIATESSFKPYVVSSVGAVGLMQVWPKWHKDVVDSAAKKHGLKGLSRRDVMMNMRANIETGAKVLRRYADISSSKRESLLRYNGSLSNPKSRYADKVMEAELKFRRISMMAGA